MNEELIRALFEKSIKAPPFERSCDRFGESSAWPGMYRGYETELAWEVWKTAWELASAAESD